MGIWRYYRISYWYFKKQKPIKIIGIEPKVSPLLTSGIIGNHKIEGIGANFIPKILDMSVIDEIITISDDIAYYGMRELALKEGIFAGISSGAAFMGALELAKKQEFKDKNIVVILPDAINNYISEL